MVRFDNDRRQQEIDKVGAAPRRSFDVSVRLVNVGQCGTLIFSMK